MQISCLKHLSAYRLGAKLSASRVHIFLPNVDECVDNRD